MKDLRSASYYKSLLKEAINCPVCENSTHFLLYNGDRYQMGVSSVICSRCGLIYINPRPTESEMNRFYQNDYRVLYNAVERPTEEYLRKSPAVDKANFVIDQLRKYLNQEKTKKLMDVGCAEGTLLSLVHNEFPGIQTFGIEPGKGFGNYAREHTQAEIFVGTYQAFFEKHNDLKFDVLTTMHVLEHILSPKEYLTTLKDHLKEDGVLYIEVPNIMNTTQKGFGVHLAHVVSYDPETLSLLLHKCGLEIVEFFTEGLPARTPAMAVICRHSKREVAGTYPKKETLEKKIQSIADRIAYTDKQDQKGRTLLSGIKKVLKSLKKN